MSTEVTNVAEESILTRRRLLAGAVSVGVAGAGAGAGTMAFFSDTETSANTISSGTLDLTLNGKNSTVPFLTATNVKPGDSGLDSVKVRNAGSITGYVDVEVASMTSYENGIVNNEQQVDNSGGDPGAGNGELHNHLEVAAKFVNGPSLWSNPKFQTVNNVLSQGTTYNENYQLAGGVSDTFVVEWQLPSGTGDEAQSDSVEFALTFHLNQTQSGGV